MTIKEIEYRAGLPRASVRYYEAEGLIRPTRAANSYREYSEEDLNTLLKIKLLRELGCPLEEILALQKNEVPLTQVLQRRLEALEGESAELERAKNLCRQLQDAGETYDTLEPGRYLAEGTPLQPWTPPPEPPKHYPWRRFFARSLDFCLYSAAVRLFLALVMGISTRHNSASDIFVVTFFALVLMVAVEPLFLRFFRTTPGKWICRLRLGKDDGTPFSYGHGALRTALVALMGCGLEIPVISLIANVWGYFRATHDELQPWETDEEQFEDTTPAHKEFSFARVLVLGILVNVLAFCCSFGGEMWVARLPFPKPETATQFAENYDRVMRYTLGDDYWTYSSSLLLGRERPEFTYEQEEGQLTAVALDMDVFSKGGVEYPGTQLACALQALEGDNAILLPGALYERCVALEAGDMDKLKTQPDGSWHVYLDYKVSGGWYYTGTFFPDRDGTQHVTVTFRARRTPKN